MRRILALLLLLCLAPPARAQEPVTVYFPVVLKGATVASCDNHWKIVVPEATTNKVLNPSAETTGNYSAAGGAVVTRSTNYAEYGLYSYYLTTAASNDGLSLILSALSNADHFVTFRSYGELPSNWRVLVRTQYRTPLLLEQIDEHWRLYGVFVPADEASTSTHLYLLQRGEGGASRYLDGFQVEAHDHWTTYCDGDRDGCGWNGAAHVSTSTRSALSRAGGRVRDLAEDYAFYVTEHSGTGAGAQRISLNEYALLPGGELNAVKAQARVWTLTGDFIADSEEDLHAKRQALLAALDPGAYGGQPVLVRYTGSTTEKEISAVYEAGLEISGMPAYYGPYRRNTTGSEWQEDYVFSERAAVRFLSPSPNWLEIGESAALLDPYDTGTLRYVAGRLRSTGQWDDLGLTANPGTNGPVYTIAIGPDGNVYVGGQFTGWNGTAGAASIDYVGMYNPNTGAWSQVGNAGDFTNIVYILTFSSDGTLYAGGKFNTGGGSATDYLATWDGTSWATLGNPTAGAAAITQVETLTWGLDGTLYIGGTFSNFAGIAAADYICKWASGSYAALGTGMNLTVTALATHPNGNIFAGGNFTTAGGGGARYIAEWDVTALSWSAVGDGFNQFVYALSIDKSGLVYVGGNFTDLFGGAGGNYNYIALWNGQTYTALGENNGMNDSVLGLAIGPDDYLYAGGIFTQAGDITLADRAAKWNGSSWAHLDLDLPGTPLVRAVTLSAPDPVVNSNYDLFLGYSTTGAGSFAGTADVENGGTAPSYPDVVISRTGGGGATIESIRNETLGLLLLLDYPILDGEELIIRLEPTEKSVTSSFFGTRPDAILANSDFGSWRLGSGTNQVTAYVNYTQSLYPAEIVAYLLWRDAYLSLD